VEKRSSKRVDGRVEGGTFEGRKEALISSKKSYTSKAQTGEKAINKGERGGDGRKGFFKGGGENGKRERDTL